MRILIVSDAWSPQVNGVVRTLKTTIELLRTQGEVIDAVEPLPRAWEEQAPIDAA